MVCDRSRTRWAEVAEVASSLLNSSAVTRALETACFNSPISTVAEAIEALMAEIAAAISSAERWA